ncbi:hypothetical protein [Pontibacter harenae]|uniref:hypothetical protein n=1 Tax=Pontibacter harenae TaxID=2894083 RepID=UPI001E49A617|nr:hypothetical protein [Pontibacter harenae]MCC9168128.1 hypothetical protein [Pontibacter harenae]
MHIEKYLSFTFQDKKPESKYQLILHKVAADYASDPNTLRLELIEKYSALLGDREKDIEEKYAFLSYQESRFKGEDKLFLDFVKWSYKDLWHEAYDFYVLTWVRNTIKPVAKGWLKSRQNISKVAISPDNDPRIVVMETKKTSISGDKIRFWFAGELLTANQKGEQIMYEDDFDLFMRSWFADTGDIAVIPPGSYLKTNVSARYLMDVIKRFYRGYGKNIHNKDLRRKMIELMPQTFEKLKDFELTTIYKNL